MKAGMYEIEHNGVVYGVEVGLERQKLHVYFVENNGNLICSGVVNPGSLLKLVVPDLEEKLIELDGVLCEMEVVINRDEFRVLYLEHNGNLICSGVVSPESLLALVVPDLDKQLAEYGQFVQTLKK